ncbi:MAG: DNA topology modulation protein FlaR [Pseudomonadota bacterium]
MHRLIITGANGAGKSHLARILGQIRPDIPVISYDALRVTKNWIKRPADETAVDMARQLDAPSWILEGGPSLLRQALPLADGLVWLDPPLTLRAWRLVLRPWQHRGHTRPELPAGNADWPLQQYRFALNSLRRDAVFRNEITARLAEAGNRTVWHCRTRRDVTKLRQAWTEAAHDRP